MSDTQFVAYDSTRRMVLWDIPTRQPAARFGDPHSTDDVLRAATTSKGRAVVAGGYRLPVNLWRLNTSN